jgi:hypothetical protein
MASELIVGVYETRRDAEEARTRLLEQGLRDEQITIDEGPGADETTMPAGDRFATRAAGEPPPEDRGVAGFIRRMFSGALMDEANIEQYTQALRNGQSVIAVRTETDAESNVATSTLARAVPRVYALPNAPSGWGQATEGDRANIGGIDEDPARPEGLLEDAEGLPVDTDRTRLSNASRAPRNR